MLNVGPAHMEFFPSLEAVADAKMELIDALGRDSMAVINGDDELLRPAHSRPLDRLWTFGVKSDADFKAENVVVGDDGCALFEIEDNRISLRVPGVHNVYNALAAYGVGRILGIYGNEAAEVLSDFESPGMRMEIVTKNGVKFINDSYNANPLSMQKAADVLDSMAVSNGGVKIAVLGDMLETRRDFSRRACGSRRAIRRAWAFVALSCRGERRTLQPRRCRKRHGQERDTMFRRR